MRCVKRGGVVKVLGLAGVGAVALLGGGCNNAGEGALSGAAIGAGAGAIIGSLTGSAGRGAIIGGAAGAIGGGVLGDQNRRNNESRGHYR
ncbi:MAG: YMGG-like glycine zipper-containing protein [bacterium]|jgi:osmotically inducible lipoprotein OsmB|nr:cell envelope biogenesis protein OmpA [Phycisphaerales bacterium]MCE2653632.1 glycine zipper domain-containing protein [Planctomycetaceae bacterium]